MFGASRRWWLNVLFWLSLVRNANVVNRRFFLSVVSYLLPTCRSESHRRRWCQNVWRPSPVRLNGSRCIITHNSTASVKITKFRHLFFFPELRNSYQLYFIIHFLFVILIASDLTGQIFNRLKTIPGLSASHFQLVLTDHLNGIDLSNPYQHDSWDYYMDIALGIICRRKPVDQLHKCLLSIFCFNCFFICFLLEFVAN
jgi:hypothetical protein